MNPNDILESADLKEHDSSVLALPKRYALSLHDCQGMKCLKYRFSAGHRAVAANESLVGGSIKVSRQFILTS
jgi:hypothetical protein